MVSDFMNSLFSGELKSATKDDIQFTRIQFERGMDYYRKRINAINFNGFNNVLDAACGCGQWTIALAEQNGFVYALDLNPGILEFARKATNILMQRNIQYFLGDLHNLPYQSESFDAVFSYGALMYTSEDVVVKELARILKPGGRIYICSDGPVWPIYKTFLGLKQGKIRYALGGPKSIALTYFFTILQGRYINKLTFLRKRDIQKLFNINNIQVNYYGPEGSYGNPQQEYFKPLYGKKFFGLPVDFEIIGIKE